MLRCGILVAGVVALLAAAPALAQRQEIAAGIVAQLRAQDFSDIVVSRTLLGRILIVGERDGMVRRIVLHPYSGDILNDRMTRAHAIAGNGTSGGSDSDSDTDDGDPSVAAAAGGDPGIRTESGDEQDGGSAGAVEIGPSGSDSEDDNSGSQIIAPLDR
jgi:hypothetical protein